jgi:pyrroloquinoline quinone biosynthesis protein B
MTRLGLTRRGARAMGHLPISGDAGSLSWLERLTIRRKVYIHINNTNPILCPTSRERRAVERAGIEIAGDGMEIEL